MDFCSFLSSLSYACRIGPFNKVQKTSRNLGFLLILIKVVLILQTQNSYRKTCCFVQYIVQALIAGKVNFWEKTGILSVGQLADRAFEATILFPYRF